MSPKKPQDVPQKSKREEFREMRRQRERRNRAIVVGIIVIGALLIVAAFALPSLQKAMAPRPTTGPVGTLNPISPVVRPDAQGLSMGVANAPVKVDVYEDFQCPMCTRYSSEVEPQIIEKYVTTGQVYYTFHNFPFVDEFDTDPLTNESHQAANASMCANAQGRFWDYHDMLFANWNGENEGSFADHRLVAFAENLGLEMDAFRACFDANQYQDEIQKDFDLGGALGITGTPSVLVNGKIVKPGYLPSFEDVSAAIEAALAGK